MASSNVLYEDNHLIAVYKPAGMLTQGDRSGHPSLMDHTREWLRRKYDKPGNVFLGLIHRLDRNVPGVVLFAKTSKGASRLSRQFRDRTVEKRYLAVVSGVPSPASGRLVHYLESARDGETVRVADRPAPGRKQAVLEYTVAASRANRSLIEVRLLTGRKHQIRAQLSAAGHPIVGDLRYGGETGPRGRAIALVAASLAFDRATPDNGATSRVAIEWPAARVWIEGFLQ